MVIWKFTENIADTITVDMPKGAQVLHVAAAEPKNDAPALNIWALVDERQPMGPHVFTVVGTGNPITYLLGTHIGTIHDGPFVWHVFDGAGQ